MGSLYNGIGLNTTKSIRNRPPVSNILELKGYAIVYNGDAAGTEHIIYEKSDPIVLNYQNSRVVHKPLKIPSNASVLQVYVRNLSNGRANYTVNSTVFPTLAQAANAWAINSYNIGTDALGVTYVPYGSITNDQINNGIVVEPAIANQLSDNSLGFQNAVLVSTSAITLAINSGTAPYNTPAPPVGAPIQNPIIVEIVFTVEVP